MLAASEQKVAPTMKITPNAFALEITDVDLASASDADFAEIKRAFAESGLIFFRDQKLTETQHIAFAERFGNININRFFAAHPDYPQVALVIKEPDQKGNIGGEWHTDHSYDVIPALGSILLARSVPETGGDTRFASMYRAFDKLSPGLQRTLEGLNAIHSAKHIFGTQAHVAAGAVANEGAIKRIGNPEAADALTDPVHPVVVRHPLSGKKALYVNPQFTLQFEGWSYEDSRPLLEYLFQLSSEEADLCRFHWEPGSIAIWDNRATWHRADNDYQGLRREMHRITIDGCALEAAVG